jgi:hypothetical protein
MPKTGIDVKSEGTNTGKESEAIKPRLMRAILKRLSQVSKKVFFIKNPIILRMIRFYACLVHIIATFPAKM